MRPFLGREGYGSVHGGGHHAFGAQVHPKFGLASTRVNQTQAEHVVRIVGAARFAKESLFPGSLAVDPCREGQLVLASDCGVKITQSDLVIDSVEVESPRTRPSVGGLLAWRLVVGDGPMTAIPGWIQDGSSSRRGGAIAIHQG